LEPICKITFKSLIAAFGVVCALGLHAEERKTGVTSAMVDDGNGIPVVEVTLHSLKHPNVAKTFRFLLDTGAALTVLDHTVPTEFFWDENQVSARFKDATDREAQTPLVIIKRMEVGGMIRDAIYATIVDLKGSILGKLQDEPVDGILGMSFLRGTRFVTNPRERRVEWWNIPSSSGSVLPITYGRDNRPTVTVGVGKKAVRCLVDTGDNGGISLPVSVRPSVSGKRNEVVASGVLGSLKTETNQESLRISGGSGFWTGARVDFLDDAYEGVIGQDVWSAGPVCFDFVTDSLTIAVGSDKELPIRRDKPRGLPIVWERLGSSQRLVVLLVKPGSAMERAGLQAGDVLLSVGSVKNSLLTRKLVNEMLLSGKPFAIGITRNGTPLTLRFQQ
jgi:hypothetical protein